MAPKKLDWEEREEVRGQMLGAGYDLTRQYGMTHTPVEKVTAAVGLGKGTFYNFFPSKERFVYEIMGYLRAQLMDYFQRLLDGREKLPIPQTREFLEEIIFSERSAHQYLTTEDEERLRVALPPEYFFGAQHGSQVMIRLLRRMGDVRVDLDERLVANLLKIMAPAQINQVQLHADALKRIL